MPSFPPTTKEAQTYHLIQRANAEHVVRRERPARSELMKNGYARRSRVVRYPPAIDSRASLAAQAGASQQSQCQCQRQGEASPFRSRLGRYQRSTAGHLIIAAFTNDEKKSNISPAPGKASLRVAWARVVTVLPCQVANRHGRASPRAHRSFDGLSMLRYGTVRHGRQARVAQCVDRASPLRRHRLGWSGQGAMLPRCRATRRDGRALGRQEDSMALSYSLARSLDRSAGRVATASNDAEFCLFFVRSATYHDAFVGRSSLSWSPSLARNLSNCASWMSASTRTSTSSHAPDLREQRSCNGLRIS